MENLPLPKLYAAAWVPGRFSTPKSKNLPLERFFPPVPEGMVSNWVQKYAAPGSWLLDPFGQNPYTSLELARAGYRVMISANNPIAAFVLRVLASAPKQQDFDNALAALLENRMPDGSTIEDYLQAFYRLDCPNEICRSANLSGSFRVHAFIWSEDADRNLFPVKAIGECPHCGHHGEIELTPAILESLGNLPSDVLIRSQILAKIAGQDPPIRQVMEEVLSFYTPRALIALHFLQNKIESSKLGPEQTQLLQALWLVAADQGNQLWTWPRANHRPKQLTRPPMFQEVNIWEAFVGAAQSWVSDEPEVKLRAWPKRVPSSGGISLFEGRLRELEDKPESGLISLVQCSLPRRNQAFWNLSGLWSGWLWGKEGVKTIRNSLVRQRYDWTWHSVALRKVLLQLPALIGSEVPVLLLTSELESLFLLAGMFAAQSAGLRLSQVSLSGDNETLQTVWRLPTSSPIQQRPQAVLSVRESGKQFLNQVGEPTQYLRLLSLTIADLLSGGLLKDRPKPNEMLNDIELQFSTAFNDAGYFHRFNPGTTPEAGLYWLAKPMAGSVSLADQCEGIILHELQRQESISKTELLARIYADLPGFLTPADELIQEILASYASTEEHKGEKVYRLLENEKAATRNADLVKVRSLIETIAERLGCRRELMADRIVLFDKKGELSHTFFPISSACVSQILSGNQDSPGQKIIVIPGSRSNLITYKLKRDPNMRLLKSEDWQLVKYRQLRNLADLPMLNQELFISQIKNDPPEFHAAQLTLF